MKKFVRSSFLIAFTLISVNVLGQNNHLAFDVKISGQGGQSIIFIPGFASSGAVWTETKALYEKDYTCYTLTMAGFAGIPAQSKETFSDWEKSIAQFIQQKKIINPIVVGHSLGGGLAMALAADYPELISKIIVIDALPCLAALTNPSFVSNNDNNCSDVVAQMTSMTDEQFYQMQKTAMPRLLADTSKIDSVLNWSLKSNRTTFANMYCDFSNTDLREKIKNIKCPSLILLESYFVNFSPAISEQFKNLTTAQLKYATKGLHFIMYDDKEWYDKQLNSFIKQ